MAPVLKVENLSVELNTKKNGYSSIGTEGSDIAEWVLIDFGDIVVQEPHDYGSLMSRVNFELTYPLSKKKESSLVFQKRH